MNGLEKGCSWFQSTLFPTKHFLPDHSFLDGLDPFDILPLTPSCRYARSDIIKRRTADAQQAYGPQGQIRAVFTFF